MPKMSTFSDRDRRILIFLKLHLIRIAQESITDYSPILVPLSSS